MSLSNPTPPHCGPNQTTKAVEFVNISAYKFVTLDDLAGLRKRLLAAARSRHLKGTILLSHEGINLFLAGEREPLDQFLTLLRQVPSLADLRPKESLSDHQPFTRMLVRIKQEIISMGVPEIRPDIEPSPKISAAELKSWLDEGRPVTLLDVRNDYEIEVGTFTNAKPVGIDHFRQFPDAIEDWPTDSKRQPVVMFCTGGIRCEKAGPLMQARGFDQVFQLEGGILKYFEECGGAHYDGECFVFDKRVALAPDLSETETQQCYVCQAILSAADTAAETYVAGVSCPRCYQTESEQRTIRIAERQQALDRMSHPLPGSRPYDNRRPFNVPLAYDRFTAIDFAAGLHAHLGRTYWEDEFSAGRIHYQQQPLAAETIVRSGWRLEHLEPGTVEPDVRANIQILFEDEDLIVVNKPAPLPMHPSGRFNRNTLLHFLERVYPGQRLRIAHRLDANTTGLVLVCRKRVAADWYRQQFEANQVHKTYLARVQGHPIEDTWTCCEPISKGPRDCGQRTVEASGLSAETRFEVRARRADGTSLVACYPRTGRTNQIRIHLWHAGHAIQGDPAYRPDGTVTENQTLPVDAPPLELHAWQLSVPHLTGERLHWEASPPDWAQCDVATGDER